jgi:hypothetical protein
MACCAIVSAVSAARAQERRVFFSSKVPSTNRVAQASMRSAIWQLYSDLKAYRCAPTAPHKADLKAALDRMFTGTTGFVTLDRLLARLHANKAELLKVLERPEIPLHTDGSKTISVLTSHGAKCQTAPAATMGATPATLFSASKTCAKLGISFWDYLCSRLTIEGSAIIPPLPQLIHAAAQPP